MMMQHYYNSVVWGCNQTGINVISCPSTAWREGWATFFALVVTPDGVMDYDIPGQGVHFPIEIPQFTPFEQGPSVTGRVAGALLDVWDTNNDNLDQNSSNPVSFGTLYTWGVQNHVDTFFYAYWTYLRYNELSSQQVAAGLQSIANNTIDYSCTLCGDANSDGTIDVSDAVFLIQYIFAGGAAPGSCSYPLGKGDADGTGTVDISDASFLVSHIFADGPCPHCLGAPELPQPCP